MYNDVDSVLIDACCICTEDAEMIVDVDLAVSGRDTLSITRVRNRHKV